MMPPKQIAVRFSPYKRPEVIRGSRKDGSFDRSFVLKQNEEVFLYELQSDS